MSTPERMSDDEREAELERLRTELDIARLRLGRIRTEALEEAARVAESYGPRCECCPQGVANAVRSLKGTTP